MQSSFNFVQAMRLLFLAIFCLCASPTRGDSPIPGDDAAVADWVRLLESSSYKEREEATRRLVELGTPAIAALERMQRESESAEARRRAGDIVAKIRWNQNVAAPPFDWSRVKPLVEKSGKITASEKWTADHSYHVTSDLHIASRTRLEIEPGVVVLVDDGVNIEVGSGGGVLAAPGNDEPGKNIAFVAASARTKSSGKWGRLKVRGTLWADNLEIRDSRGVELHAKGSALLGAACVYDTLGDGITFAGQLSRNPPDMKGHVTIRNASGIGCHVLNGVSVDTLEVVGAKVGIKMSKGSSLMSKAVRVQYALEEGVLSERGAVEAERLRVEHCAIGISLRVDALRTNDAEVRHCSRAGVVAAGQADCKRLVVSDIAGDAVMLLGPDSRIEELDLENIAGNGVVIGKRAHPTLYDVTATNVRGKHLVLLNRSHPFLGPAVRKAMSENRLTYSISDDSFIEESETASQERQERELEEARTQVEKIRDEAARKAKQATPEGP